MATVFLPTGIICQHTPGDRNPRYEIARSCSDRKYGAGYKRRKTLLIFLMFLQSIKMWQMTGNFPRHNKNTKQIMFF